MHFEPHCKICKSDLAEAILFLHVCEHASYKQIIDRYRHALGLNEYNISTHFNRHVEQSDIDIVKATKCRWAQIDAELRANA